MSGRLRDFSSKPDKSSRLGRFEKGRTIGIPPSSIPWLAMGSWLLCIGWFGFNVMSAQSVQTVSGLVAINSLMAMCGGILAALIAGDGDPGFIHNGALAGLVAICAGSDVVHPVGALLTRRMIGQSPGERLKIGAQFAALMQFAQPFKDIPGA